MKKTMEVEIDYISMSYYPNLKYQKSTWDLTITYNCVKDDNITTREVLRFETYEKFRQALDKIAKSFEEDNGNNR